VEDINQWKEAITGEPYDLDFLGETSAKMDVRQELWKYFEVSSLLIREWSEAAFKKVWHMLFIFFFVDPLIEC